MDAFRSVMLEYNDLIIQINSLGWCYHWKCQIPSPVGARVGVHSSIGSFHC